MIKSIGNNSFPYIVAGPCSVESQEQLTSVVEALSATGRVAMIRCGVWKPRTRPGGFEGLGEQALRWMRQLKTQDPQLRFCCEVASPSHVELCLSYGIDAVWIGARTAANPFSVNELSEALRGTALPVMVKNPMMPDVNAWIGALERCIRVGSPMVVAVHRGFDVYNNLGYRNNPLWEIPMELRRRMPEMPIICDPSHICGNRDTVAAMSQTAIDFNFDGLMLEVHPHPDQALTDARQQLTPEAFVAMLDALELKHEHAGQESELALLRGQIDAVDKELLTLIGSRLEISRQIAQVKKANSLTIFQPKRWDDVLNQKLRMAEQMGLSATFVKELFEKIHAESVRVQEEATRG